MTSKSTHTSYKPLGPGPFQEEALLWVRQNDDGYRPDNSGATEAYRYWKGEPIFITHLIWKEDDGSTHQVHYTALYFRLVLTHLSSTG